MHDVITQINLQLPMIVETGSVAKLPTTVVKDGVCGGSVTRTAEIYLTSSGNAFNPVRAVVCACEWRSWFGADPSPIAERCR
ncbi:hypothetical protein AOZ06_40790 [Kibdelosporangium phytohabitans]|uniref:Uncharacterized protein n=1 Tax=Kibdelosporangium phytohabitans TaxID=860235 RepID=A0A0N9HYF5_9PSEU|nr:hypothetical protein AOZ06_40790 [Kibdelosporangium phytohabitans]